MKSCILHGKYEKIVFYARMIVRRIMCISWKVYEELYFTWNYKVWTMKNCILRAKYEKCLLYRDNYEKFFTWCVPNCLDALNRRKMEGGNGRAAGGNGRATGGNGRDAIWRSLAIVFFARFTRKGTLHGKLPTYAALYETHAQPQFFMQPVKNYETRVTVCGAEWKQQERHSSWNPGKTRFS